jgi:membrane protein required for colicin V production
MVDRLLGLVFGFVRGAVVVAIFVLLGQFVELTQVDWWKESQLLPYAAELSGWIQTFAETGAKELEEQATQARRVEHGALQSSSVGV